MFALAKAEKDELVTNCDRFETMKHSSVMPYAFTEQGVAMFSSVLKSPTAVEVNIQIMRAFVAMRHFLQNNAQDIQQFNTQYPTLTLNHTTKMHDRFLIYN